MGGGGGKEKDLRISRFNPNGKAVLDKQCFGRVNEQEVISVQLQELPKGDIGTPLQLRAKMIEDVGMKVVKEDWVNVFLPVIPPQWNYRYCKLIGKELHLYKDVIDTAPVVKLDLTKYCIIRKAEKQECFQKFSIRLI